MGDVEHFWPDRPVREDLACALVQSIGVVLASVGLALLLAAVPAGHTLAFGAVLVYGVTLVSSYLASALYHATGRPRRKVIFAAADNVAIFAVIAGTYTPIALIPLLDNDGAVLCALVWVMALSGIFARFSGPARFERNAVYYYLAVGWGGVLLWLPSFYQHLGASGFTLLLAGGLSYSAGTAVYRWRSLPYNHVVWHLFVMAGAACHYAVQTIYVLPGLAG